VLVKYFSGDFFDMDSNQTFGLILRRLRTEKELTQSDLAALAGLTQEEIARFEADGRKPSWVTVHKIAKALEVTCEAFRDAAEHEAAQPRKERIVKRKPKSK
jgi:transcriptional regulator with XRE-family HTH domain